MGAFGAIAPAETKSLLVPLENLGGPGTRFAHWRESVFETELMAGFADPVSPLSAVTVGTMRDLGYVVNDVPADPFDLGAALRAPSLQAAPLPHTRPWGGAAAGDRRARPDPAVVPVGRPDAVPARIRPGALRATIARSLE
jgi:hypothetical protein